MLIKLCFVLMLAAHLIGCLFWGLFTYSDGTPIAPDGWIVNSGLQNVGDPFEQYIPTVCVRPTNSNAMLGTRVVPAHSLTPALTD